MEEVEGMQTYCGDLDDQKGGVDVAEVAVAEEEGEAEAVVAEEAAEGQRDDGSMIACDCVRSSVAAGAGSALVRCSTQMSTTAEH